MVSYPNFSVAEIKLILEQVECFQDSRLEEFAQDPRLSVQKELDKARHRLQKYASLIVKYQEMSVFENQAISNGYHLIAGIDEVGRGSLAGPVLAAAVILPKGLRILGLDDSKKLSKKRREELSEFILKEAQGVGIGMVEPNVIDEINIYEASKKAMIFAINHLPIAPDFLLIDAMKLVHDLPQKNLIKGDTRSVSIAAASVVAKVTRDKIMENYAKKYPEYGFERHSGYGTKKHLEALTKYGVSSIHRKTFAPVRARVGLV